MEEFNIKAFFDKFIQSLYDEFDINLVCDEFNSLKAETVIQTGHGTNSIFDIFSVTIRKAYKDGEWDIEMCVHSSNPAAIIVSEHHALTYRLKESRVIADGTMDFEIHDVKRAFFRIWSL